MPVTLPVPSPGPTRPRFAAIARSLGALATAALWLASLGLVAMTLMVAWQVFARYVLNASPSWTEPGSLLLMSWFILLGAAVGVRERDHLGFEIGLHAAPPALRRVLLIVTEVLVAGFGAAMAWYGFDLARETWSANMAGLAIPQGMDYLPLVGGGGLIALFSLEKLLLLFSGADEAELAVPVSPHVSVE
jgi:TRAP-type C4-dicarboxylate transport system permease small subunit